MENPPTMPTPTSRFTNPPSNEHADAPANDFLIGLEQMFRAAHLEGLFRNIVDALPRRPGVRVGEPTPLAMQLVLAAERLRLLAGDHAQLGVVVSVPDRTKFDQIRFPHQVETGCPRDGVRMKAFVEEPLRVIALHVEREAIPFPPL